MRTDIREAEKIPISTLVHRAQSGEEVVLEENGTPIAKLVSIPFCKPASEKAFRVSGSMKGKIKMKDNFDDPLPSDIATAFGVIE